MVRCASSDFMMCGQFRGEKVEMKKFRGEIMFLQKLLWALKKRSGRFFFWAIVSAVAGRVVFVRTRHVTGILAPATLEWAHSY